MSSKLKIAIFAALFFGFITAYGIYNFLSEQRETAKALKLATQDLVVATKKILPGTTLSAEMVKVTSWPKTSVPAGSFTTPQQVIGKVVNIKTHAAEPVTESKLAGEGKGLTIRLTPGLRAMAVKVDEIVGVSGFIAPGDRVDVITTMDHPAGNSGDERVSKVVLQNKRVLSVAQRVEREDDKPKVVRSITLEVTPEEAEKLSLASLQGNIILALRAVGDKNIVSTRGSTIDDLLAVAAGAAGKNGSAGATTKKYQVEVYLGSQRSVQEF